VYSKLTTKFLFVVWMAIVLLLAACGGAPASPATPTPIEEPTATSLPIEEPATIAIASPVAEAGTTGGGVSGVHTYVIVPEESKATYLVDEEFFEGALAKYGIQAGLVDTIGSTQEIEGELQLNLGNLSAPLGDNRFTVNLATLTTNQSLRDRWIRENGPQFNKFPVAEFRGTAIEGAPETYVEGDEVQFKLMGDLTIREITQPVTFDVTAKLEGNTITGVATAQLLMTDFGIDPPNFANTLTVGNEFVVQVEFTAREK
jgi:polyisoprenoid-binding protein YceI